MLNLDGRIVAGTHSDAIITFYLYEIDYAESYPDGEGPLRWTTWGEEIAFDGNLYTPVTIKHSSISQNSEGQFEDITVTIGNADRIIQYYIEQYEIIGKNVKITQCFLIKKEDDTYDTLGFLSGRFKIAGVTAKKDIATFKLSIGFNFLKSQCPNRIVSSRFCQWSFRSDDCKYAGSDTDCEKSFEDCKRKGNLPNFGGFPGVINERFYL